MNHKWANAVKNPVAIINTMLTDPCPHVRFCAARCRERSPTSLVYEQVLLLTLSADEKSKAGTMSTFPVLQS